MTVIGFGLLGYLSGSLPFAIWVTQLVKGVDVRNSGSGHASTTNTFRQTGLGPGIVVLVLDIAKGFIPTYLAATYSESNWSLVVAGGFAVVGHCWPLFAGFRGGMGLATAGGSLLAVYPFGFAIALGILITLTLLLKHSARASFIAALFFAPTFYLLGQRGSIIWLMIGIGLVLAYRFLIDWNREYKELWLDRVD